MGNVTKVKTTDNTQYNIKDNSGTLSSHLHHDEDLVPLVSKTYASTSYYATSNDYANASWYFMSVKPNAWYQPWTVRLKVRTKCPNQANWYSYTWATISGRTDGVIYANWNELSTTAHTYITFYPLKQAGFNAGYGHAIGISIYNGNAPTTASNYRTFEIDYYSCDNCTVDILDTPVKWESWTGTGTTNYGSLSSFNANSRGLQESGDSDTYDALYVYFGAKTGIQGIWAGSLCMQDGTGAYQNICTASDGTATNSNRTTATTKIANSNGFLVGGTIYYSSGNYNANTNISGWGSIRSRMANLIDARYCFNVTLTANSLTPYSQIYLVGTINSANGLFYLDQTWWTQTPNATDKIYILVGGVYDSTTSNCRFVLYETNPWYKYDGTKLVELTNGHIVNKDVPSDAVFTDHTYSGTGLISVNSSGVISTTAEANQNAFSNVKVGSTTIAADSKTDTVELVAGDNVTLTPDATNDKVTISATDTTYESKTEASGGTDLSLVTTGEKYTWNHNSGGTDEKVKQSTSTDNADYRVILSNSANDTEETAAVKKNSSLKYNPSTGNLQTTQLNGVTVGSSPKFTDANVTQTASTANASLRLLLSNGANDDTETAGVKKTAKITHNPSSGGTTFAGHITVNRKDGTTSTVGTSQLVLGNGTASGVDENSRGRLVLYSDSSKYCELKAADSVTSNREIFLPNNGGTVALTSDLNCTNTGALCAQAGTTVGSLNDLVALLWQSASGRAYCGTVKITANLGIGISANTWQRLFAVSQNAPNNGVYGVQMYCLFFPEDTATNIKWALITGATTNNYSVVGYGEIVPTDTNNKVTITHSTSNNSYPICFEAHNNTTEYTTKIFKTTKLTVNASTGRLGLGNASYTESGITLASNGGIWNDTQLLRLMASNESDYYVDLGIKETSSPGWTFCPAVTKKLRLGSPSKLWTTVYAQTGSINTSDRKEKKDIVSLDERAKNFIMALNPVSYKFIDGNSGRTHYGMIAQDVEEEMTELGMTAMDFAGFCKDQKNTDYKDSEGHTKQMPILNEYVYGLRYEEFIAPMIKTIQMQQQEIDELKSELAEIKALLLNK